MKNQNFGFPKKSSAGSRFPKIKKTQPNLQKIRSAKAAKKGHQKRRFGHFSKRGERFRMRNFLNWPTARGVQIFKKVFRGTTSE